MRRSVIEDDNVARHQGRQKELLDPRREQGAVDRAIQDQGSHDAVMAQAGQEGERLPVAMRNLGQVRLAARASAADAGHVGLHPGLVDEDQPARIKPALMGFPAAPEPRQLGAILLFAQQRFFDAQAQAAHAPPHSVRRDHRAALSQLCRQRPDRRSPFSAKRSRSQSTVSALSTKGRCPPILPG